MTKVSFGTKSGNWDGSRAGRCVVGVRVTVITQAQGWGGVYMQCEPVPGGSALDAEIRLCELLLECMEVWVHTQVKKVGQGLKSARCIDGARALLPTVRDNHFGVQVVRRVLLIHGLESLMALPLSEEDDKFGEVATLITGRDHVTVSWTGGVDLALR